MQTELFSLGLIANTQGLQGWVKLVLNTKVETLNPENLKLVFTSGPQKTFLPLQVEKCETKGINYLLKFKDLNNINDVLFLKGREILVAKDQENVSFICQINWTEYSVQLNQEVGTVVDWMHNGAQGLIKVQSQTHQFWVPMVEAYLEKVDHEKKMIYLINYEGLM